MEMTNELQGRRNVQYIFETMHMYYGMDWFYQFGSEKQIEKSRDVWAAQLAHIEHKTIIKMCAKFIAESDKPPTLAKFLHKFKPEKPTSEQMDQLFDTCYEYNRLLQEFPDKEFEGDPMARKAYRKVKHQTAQTDQKKARRQFKAIYLDMLNEQQTKVIEWY